MAIDRCYIEITNVCNLNCDFCPKHGREHRRMSLEEFDLVTDKIKERVVFLYFHLMGEPMLHPQLPQFVEMAKRKGFKTVLTSNGTLMHRANGLLSSLPHKIQLSLHSHEGNDSGGLEEYIKDVMLFSLAAAKQGTCMVLRLWNQGGRDAENDSVLHIIQHYVARPWVERSDGFRLCDNVYLEFDRKFRWPEVSSRQASERQSASTEYYCKALRKQIGILADGSLVPCCLDHNGDVVLGNLFSQSLDEILSSPRAETLVDGFERHCAIAPLCRNCESALVHNSFRGKKKMSAKGGG